MDPISVSALAAVLSKVFGAMGDKAGGQLWDSLSALVRRSFGRGSSSVEVVERLGERPGDPDSIKALAQALAADCARDPDTDARLRQWVATAEQTFAQSADTTNTINGQVFGNVVQARDIHGDIRF